MSPNVPIIGVSVALGVALVHRVLSGRKRPPNPPAGRSGKTVVRYSLLERAVLVAVGVSFIVLAATGFGGVIFSHGMHGWSLFAHTGASGVFLIALTALIVRGAEEHRFVCPESHPNAPASKFDNLEKTLFWLTAVLGLGCVLTMLLCMLPWFGTHGMETLMQLHRLSGLGLLGVVILNAYATLTKSGGVRSILTGRMDVESAAFYHPGWMEGSKNEESKHEHVQALRS